MATVVRTSARPHGLQLTTATSCAPDRLTGFLPLALGEEDRQKQEGGRRWKDGQQRGGTAALEINDVLHEMITGAVNPKYKLIAKPAAP